MPASISAIMKNVERLSDPKLIELWNEAAKTQDDNNQRTPVQAWTAFIQAADDAKLADKIPGSVGRTFKAKYAAEPPAQPATKKHAARRPSGRAACK